MKEEDAQLVKLRKRILHILQVIEDRCIENMADMAELNYLQYEVDSILEKIPTVN